MSEFHHVRSRKSRFGLKSESTRLWTKMEKLAEFAFEVSSYDYNNAML